MQSAIWLFRAVPKWYFLTILDPFSALYLSAIPASGVVTLFIGAALALIGRERGAYWIAIPLLLSQLYVTASGFFRGQLRAEAGWMFWGFLVVQLALSALIVAKCSRSRPAGIFLGWFSFSYAFHAGFVAIMSFSDSWL